MTAVAAKIDEFGKPAWIALIVLGFIVWWPIGLGTLAYAIWSRRMANGYSRAMNWCQPKSASGTWWQPSSTGNRAFDEYRTETLRRLEDEQREFRDFLERLRMAKDKAEFDQFMSERRDRPMDNPSQQQG
jgi:hypothetical protein